MMNSRVLVVTSREEFSSHVTRSVRNIDEAHGCVQLRLAELAGAATALDGDPALVVVDAVQDGAVVSKVVRTLKSLGHTSYVSVIVVHDGALDSTKAGADTEGWNDACVAGKIQWRDPESFSKELTEVIRREEQFQKRKRDERLSEDADPYEEQGVTCLCADLQDYTKVAAEAELRDENDGLLLAGASQLNDVRILMYDLARFVEDYSGEVRGFRGDSIHAVFRPGDNPRSSFILAVHAAQQMELTARLFEWFKKSSRQALHVGISCGRVIWENQPYPIWISGPASGTHGSTPGLDTKQKKETVRSATGITVIESFRLSDVRPRELNKALENEPKELRDAIGQAVARPQQGLILVAEKAWVLHSLQNREEWIERTNEGKVIPSFLLDLKGLGVQPVLLLKRLSSVKLESEE